MTQIPIEDLVRTSEYEDVLNAVLESVAFCVYDEKKMEEIFMRASKIVWEKHGTVLDWRIIWNPPVIKLSINGSK